MSSTSTMLKLCMRRKKSKLPWIECETSSKRKIIVINKHTEETVPLRICFQEIRIDMINLHQEEDSSKENENSTKKKVDSMISKDMNMPKGRDFTQKEYNMRDNSKKVQEKDRKNQKSTTATFKMLCNTVEIQGKRRKLSTEMADKFPSSST